MVSKTHDSGGLMVSDYPADEELPTNYLQSEVLNAPDVFEQGHIESMRQGEGEEPESIDWLAKLTSSHTVQPEEGDAPPAPAPPSGMSEHATASHIAPTIGARLSTAFKRGTAFSLILILALGAGGAGAYAITSTSWLGDLFTLQPPVAPQSANSEKKGSGQQSQTAPTESPKIEPEQANLAGTPASAIRLRDKGIEEYKAGKFKEAISTLGASLALNSDDAITYYQLGMAHLAAPGEEYALADAEMAFRTAASLQPNWAAPHLGLAESLIRRGYSNEAVIPAQEATRIEPTLSEAWMTLGRSLHGAGRDAEATRAFAEAARRAPAPPPLP